MILDRQVFNYQERILIEKITVQAPFKHEALFQNEGCFLYFKNSNATIFTAENKIQIKSKEAVLLRCGNYYLDLLRKSDNDKIEIIAVHLYPEILKKIYIKELPALIKKRNFTKESQLIASENIISKFIESLEFYFQNPFLVNDDLLELKIKELILLLVQTKNADSILALITDLYSSKSVDLKEVVESHLYSNLSVDELAKLSNLSLSSFKREFKKEFNDSPNNYIISKKIEKAKELLHISEMGIGEIAYEIGFNDPLYFTRIFKKKVGVTPSTFRLN